MARYFRRRTFLNFLILLVIFWTIWLINVAKHRQTKVENNGEEAIELRALNFEAEEKVFEAGKVFEEVTQELKSQSVEEQSKFEVSIDSLDPPELSPEILELHSRLNLTNPGRMGEPVILPSNLPFDIQEMVNKSWETYKINEFVSNLIPLYRELPDVRSEHCKNMIYSDNLPVTSVIMVFHNEPFSLIMRTVFSVLMVTPPELLKEIVLVDDCSEYENLKQPLKDMIKKYPKIKLIRMPIRVGLIKARMIGCINAEGEALVFMDAHIEVTEGWLEPLLDPLVKNHNASTVPVIHTLGDTTLGFFHKTDPKNFHICGFDWNMIFSWIEIPEREHKRLKSPWDPVRSPTMLGAFFAIRKDYFELLGMYDEEFEIWGAENLELAFKVWMCGGELLMIPCSHCGHVFKKKRPYLFPRGGIEVLWNVDRLAEVWLDEYIRFFHRATAEFKNRKFGDVSKQKKLRRDLGCKSFKWYIENVYPEVKYPNDVKYQISTSRTSTTSTN